MTQYKIQHFVPQWYQRNFSPDINKDGKDEHIWVYDLKSDKIELSKIYETAQKEYFYGKDGEFEKSLQLIETGTARAVNTIIKNENLDGLADSTRKNLFKFLLLQSTRTESSKVIVENLHEKYVEYFIKLRLRLYEKSPGYNPFIESLKKDENLFQYAMKIALASVIAISDLKPFLLINKTEIPFFTSDYPVVVNNYNYKKMRLGTNTLGIQIICPITDKICLLLIHSELYRIIGYKQSKIEISADTDIDSINYLQILNCYRKVFSKQNNLEYIRTIRENTLKIRENNKLPQVENGDDDNLERNYATRFSFLKNTPKCGAIISQYAKDSYKANEKLPFRNKNLLDKARSQTDSIIASYIDEYRSKLERNSP